MVNRASIRRQIEALKPFMSNAQIAVLSEAVRGEESEHFSAKIAEYADRVTLMPKTYEQDGKGAEAVAHLHYFKGSRDWYVTERDMGNAQHQAFGLVFGHDAEMGYISIAEITQAGVEIDLHFEPRTLKEIRAEHEAKSEFESGAKL